MAYHSMVPRNVEDVDKKACSYSKRKAYYHLLHMETAQLLACVLSANHLKQDEVRCQTFQAIWASWQPSTRQQFASYLTKWSKFNASVIPFVHL